MSIQGYAEAVRDGVVEGDEVGNSLNIIISESQRLKKIVEEMILITKLDDANEKFKFSNHSTIDLINESLNAVNPLLHINSVEIDIMYDKDVTICVDSEKFKRALINIIGNCCRYARHNITISFASVSGRLYLDIKDDGRGFNPGEEKFIFERFYKGEKGGSGIGLTLSRTIINRHGGDLIAVNNIGLGALFKIDIPLDGNCN
jgi:signal transduction histidine kinase